MLSQPALPPVMRLWMVRLWAALLVAVIGLQATAPAAVTLHQTHGSAFSAATYEMAVHRQVRDEDPVKLAIAEPPVDFVSAAPFPRPPLVPAIASRPNSTGPPLHGIRATPAAPRAPPHA